MLGQENNAEICSPKVTSDLDVTADSDLDVTADSDIDATADSEIDKNNLKPKSDSVNKKSTLTCDTCGKKFFKLHRLEGHLRQHQGLKVCLSLS